MSQDINNIQDKVNENSDKLDDNEVKRFHQLVEHWIPSHLIKIIMQEEKLYPKKVIQNNNTLANKHNKKHNDCWIKLHNKLSEKSKRTMKTMVFGPNSKISE